MHWSVTTSSQIGPSEHYIPDDQIDIPRYPMERDDSNSEYVAPSWSWASVQAPVYFCAYMGPNFNQVFTIQHAEVALQAAGNPYGALLSGKLVARGLIMTVHALEDQYDHRREIISQRDSEEHQRVLTRRSVRPEEHDKSHLIALLTRVSGRLGWVVSTNPGHGWPLCLSLQINSQGCTVASA